MSPTPAKTTSRPSSGVTALRIVDFEFRPRDLVVAPGTTVRATNEDSATHDWTSTARLWASGDLRSGEGFSYTFTTPGRFDYLCSIHPSMEGAVTVR